MIKKSKRRTHYSDTEEKTVVHRLIELHENSKKLFLLSSAVEIKRDFTIV